MLILDRHNIVYEREKRFSDLRGTTSNSRLRYDFYIPSMNLLIEYDGEQHFRPIRTKGRLSPEQAMHQYEITMRNDAAKNEYAAINGYRLLRIGYAQDAEEILIDLLRFL